MAQKAKLVITFERDVASLERVSFQRVLTGVGLFVEIKSVFLPMRTQNGQLPIEPPTSIPGESAAIAFENYFNIDHNNQAGLMTCVRGLNTITIEINQLWHFANWSSTCGATFEYYPPIEDTFKISTVSFMASPNPCETVRVRVITTEIADTYFLELGSGNAGSKEGAQVPVSSKTVLIDIPRAIPVRIGLRKAGQTILRVEQFLSIPNLYFTKLLESNVTIMMLVNPTAGASVSISVDYPLQQSQRPPLTPPELEYSLNGTVWVQSRLFSGQVDGNYTAWVRDSLGCVVTKNFVIKGIKTGRDEYAYISDLNSIGFAVSQKWDGVQDGIDKNPENTLALYETQTTLYDETLVYRQKDKVKIQIKSNYDYNSVSIQGCDKSNSYQPIIIKKSNNLDKFEELDAKMYSYGNGSQTALYFDNGNVYNRSGVVMDQYELNGNLPDFAVAGNLVQIVTGGNYIGGSFRIADVFYDSSIGKNVIIFNFDCDEVFPVNVRARAIYDLLPFEVYEFEIDFAILFSSFSPSPIGIARGDRFRVKVSCTDDLYDDKIFYSNWIELIKNSSDYDLNRFLSINYANNNNRSIFYLYGITHFFRAEVESVSTLIDDEVSIVKGDSSTYLSESVVNEGITVRFAPVTHKVLMKLILATSSESLFINGLGYVKKDSVEVEPEENTNTYTLTCTFIKNSQNFNTFAEGRTGDEEDYRTVYIPQLITTNLGGSLKV